MMNFLAILAGISTLGFLIFWGRVGKMLYDSKIEDNENEIEMNRIFKKICILKGDDFLVLISKFAEESNDEEKLISAIKSIAPNYKMDIYKKENMFYLVKTDLFEYNYKNLDAIGTHLAQEVINKMMKYFFWNNCPTIKIREAKYNTIHAAFKRNKELSFIPFNTKEYFN